MKPAASNQFFVSTLRSSVSGYDIFDAIRAVPELRDIPIVAVTASDPDVEMKKAREKGFSGYISKPLDHSSFTRQIAATLEGQEIWDE